ncbi:MAG: CRISPR-associated protein Cas4, partial [Pirellulaceae bacterium]
MIARPSNAEQTVELPDYLPARMLNEFVYCPRLFFYEWVEGVFAHNQETVEGAIRHRKLDAAEGALPLAEELAASRALFHTRSIQLASEQHRLIAKLDVLEAAEGLVTPVDYKRGSPRSGESHGSPAPQAWDPDRVQLAVQGLVLRDNGYRCDEGIVYYAATKQRVRVPIDATLVQETLEALRRARELA